MALIETQESPVFNLEKIHERDLIRARYQTWPEPRNGLVQTVNKDMVMAIFMPAIHKAVCCFRIKAQEVKDGKWEITCTRDFETIEKVAMANDGDPDDGSDAGNGDDGSLDTPAADGE